MEIRDKALDPLFIRVEDSQFILCEQKTTEAGKEHEVNVGYFISLPVLIRRATQIKAAKSQETKTLSEFIQHYKAALQELLEAVKI